MRQSRKDRQLRAWGGREAFVIRNVLIVHALTFAVLRSHAKEQCPEMPRIAVRQVWGNSVGHANQVSEWRI